jgi:hypothetical protein
MGSDQDELVEEWPALIYWEAVWSYPYILELLEQ